MEALELRYFAVVCLLSGNQKVYLVTVTSFDCCDAGVQGA